MYLSFFGAFLRDVLKLMKNEQDFMDRPENERRDLVTKYMGQDYPAAFLAYLVAVKDESFLEQVKGVVEYLNMGIVPKNKLFFEAVAEYIAKDFAMKFDRFDRDFFYSDDEERIKVLNEYFPGDSFLIRSVRDYVMGGTYQEITEDAQQLLRGIKGDSMVVVQSSVEINKEVRKQIRDFFSGKYPYSFVEFQINPQIIGGLRVFIDGQVMDNSWLSKIQKISNLSYQLS